MRILLIVSLLAALAPPARAAATEPPPPALDGERQQLEARIARELGAGTPAPAPAAPPPSSPGGGPAPWARLLAIPDISAVGSFAAVYDDYDVGQLSPRDGPLGPAGKATFLFQELELGLRAVVDPYFRADVF